MSASDQVFFAILTGLGWIVAPTMLIWGWIRWIHRPKQRTFSSNFSLIGFLLATTSALLAISLLGYGMMYRLDFYAPWPLRIFRTAVSLSLAGIVFGIGGVWRPNSLRWHSPVFALGTLAFWIALDALQ